jgi:hypothetical protein
MFGTLRSFGFSACIDGTSNTALMSEFVVYDPAPSAEVEGAGTGKVKGSVRLDLPWTDVANDPSLCFNSKAAGNTGMMDGTRFNNTRGGVRFSGRPVDGGGFSTVLPPNSPSCGGEYARTVGTVNQGASPYYFPGLMSPTSNHVGGVNMSRVDGSAAFISNTIYTGSMQAPSPDAPGSPRVQKSPYGVWGALGTRDGGESTASP